jgi:predicted AAA+ superfamily ATPase
MYDRLLFNKMMGNRRNVLLLGPRQVGKSTLLASLNPDLTLNLASPQTFREYLTQPERLEYELTAKGSNFRTVFIDEVQKVPALLDTIQTLVDAQPTRWRFFLSGSSARKLRRGHANLLPGRIHRYDLSPLVAKELGEAFNLNRVLAHGTLPGIYAEEDAELRAQDLRGYVDAYLREEVQAEALVRNLGGYARLLELVAASSGRILNVNALCREAGISYETTRRYLEVLEDTLLVYRIPAWSGTTRSSLIAHPKYYFFDLGVRNALLRRPLDRCLDDERGLLLEHLLAQELTARRGILWPEMACYHYRTRHGAEIDFVLEIGQEIWAIEVKSAQRVSRSDLSGFSSLTDRTKRVTRKLLIYLGTRRQQMDDVEILPLKEFLNELPG